MHQILTLPKAAEQVIYEFTHLPLGGKEVVCPYHINIRKERVGLRALVGKGNPGEIIQEVKVWAKLKDFDLEKATAEQIREFMIDRSIGIECSGFVTHVIGYYLKTSRKKHLQDYLVYENNSIIALLRRLLRPIENINANTLTSTLNCDAITDLNEVKPGDFIRSKGKVKNSYHIMLVRKVILEDGKVKELEYVHSTRNYGANNGVRFGRILIDKPGEALQKQNWLEKENGKIYSLEDFLNQVEDNGVRRLKRVKLAFESQD